MANKIERVEKAALAVARAQDWVSQGDNRECIAARVDLLMKACHELAKAKIAAGYDYLTDTWPDEARKAAQS